MQVGEGRHRSDVNAGHARADLLPNKGIDSNSSIYARPQLLRELRPCVTDCCAAKRALCAQRVSPSCRGGGDAARGSVVGQRSGNHASRVRKDEAVTAVRHRQPAGGPRECTRFKDWSPWKFGAWTGFAAGALMPRAQLHPRVDRNGRQRRRALRGALGVRVTILMLLFLGFADAVFVGCAAAPFSEMSALLGLLLAVAGAMQVKGSPRARWAGLIRSVIRVAHHDFSEDPVRDGSNSRDFPARCFLGAPGASELRRLGRVVPALLIAVIA